MKKESKKRIVVIVICILLLLALLIVVFGSFKNVEAQKKEDNLISSEAVPGTDIDDVHTDAGVRETETYSIASVRDAGETEGMVDSQNEMKSDKAMSEKNMSESKVAGISIEAVQIDSIITPDMNSYSDSESHSTDSLGSADETEGTSENRQELSSEEGNNDLPTAPIDREDDTDPSIPDEIEEEGTVFEKAQKASELQGKSSYYEYYLNNMSSQEKQELYDSAPSPAEFLDWVSDLRKEYDKDHKHDLPEEIYVGN